MNTDPRGGWTSASNALSDSLCPGRHLAQAGLPDVKGDYAEHGSRIHAALANSRDRAFMQSLTLEEREIFDACRDIEAKVANQFFGTAVNPNGIERMRVFREERYWVKFKDDTGRELAHSGQCDVVYRAGTKALVMEYKTLLGDVAGSPRNMQLRDQAVLVRGHFVVIDQVGVAVIQPMVTHSPEICLYTKDDLDRAAAELFLRVSASNDPRSRRVPGEHQCQYCRAKRVCVEYQKWAGQMAPPMMLNVLEVPMQSWSPEQRAIAAGALLPAQKFLDDLKEFLKQGLKTDPSFVPGWTLGDSQHRETITDPQTCFDRFTKVGGDVTAFMKAVKVTKGKLREAVHAASSLKGKELDDAMRALLDGIVEVKVTEPSLKKEDR